VSFDVGAFDRFARDEDLRRHGKPAEPEDPELTASRKQAARALRHALAEFDVTMHTVVPSRPLGELLAG